MKTLFLNLLLFSLLIAGSDVDKFGSYEISVTLSGSVAESAYQYGGFVTITGDSGEAKGYSFVRHGFLDTPTVLKFRVYVPFEGRYTYSATENYAGITISSGATGTFRCLNVDKTKHGMVRIDANNNFYTDDGNLFHPMLETAWNFTHWDIYKTLAQKKIWVDSCVAQNFNVMTIRSGASVSTTQTLNGEIPFLFGSTNYNLNTINLSWWAPADSIVLYTAEKGMVLAIALGFGDPLSSYPITELTKWYQYIDARWGSYPHVLPGFYEFNNNLGAATAQQISDFWTMMQDSSSYGALRSAHPQTSSTIPMAKANVEFYMSQYLNQAPDLLWTNARTYADSVKVFGAIENAYYCDPATMTCKSQDDKNGTTAILNNEAAILFADGHFIGTGSRNLWGAPWNATYLSSTYRTYMKFFQKFRMENERYVLSDTFTKHATDSTWFQMSKADLIHCIYFSRDPGATTFNFTDMTDVDGGRWYDVLTGTYGNFLAVGSGASESINPPAANQIFILKRKSYTAASIITVTQ